MDRRAARPAGSWSIIRATVHERQDAEHFARSYKADNPKLRFRYRAVDEDGEPIDGNAPVEV